MTSLIPAFWTTCSNFGISFVGVLLNLSKSPLVSCLPCLEVTRESTAPHQLILNVEKTKQNFVLSH